MLGRRAGYRAALWGGICGTVPDLDVLTAPFLSDMQQLAVHRGLSHSLVFALVGGWAAGKLLSRLHGAYGSDRQWGLLALLAFSTHILIDCFTVYGTQIFQPFSDYPVAWSSVFIIDPLYTLPLLGLLIAALSRQRTSRWRRRLNGAGLALSTAYLLLTLVNQQRVEAAMHRSLADQALPYGRLMSTPTPLNNLLWMGIADQGDTLRVGLRSVLDEGPHIAWKTLPKNSHLIAPYLGQPAIERLLWFCRGYYTTRWIDGQLYLHDLRFGRSDSWMADDGQYIFNFALQFDPQDPSRTVGFVQQQPSVRFEDESFEQLWGRVWERIWRAPPEGGG